MEKTGGHLHVDRSAICNAIRVQQTLFQQLNLFRYVDTEYAIRYVQVLEVISAWLADPELPIDQIKVPFNLTDVNKVVSMSDMYINKFSAHLKDFRNELKTAFSIIQYLCMLFNILVFHKKDVYYMQYFEKIALSLSITDEQHLYYYEKKD